MKKQNNAIHLANPESRPLLDDASYTPYQRSKARAIAASLILAACESETLSMKDLPELAAHFDEATWRTVSFNAGEAVADLPARVLTLAYLAKTGK